MLPDQTSCLLSHQILKELESLASKKASETGFELSDVQVQTHTRPIAIKIQIKNQDGHDVSLEDCARFSKPMADCIEESQLLKEAYVLEISSSGIGEQLLHDRDFITFKGFPVEVIYKDSNDSELRSKGLLHERSSEHIHLNIKGRMNLFPRVDVTSVRLISPNG